MKMILSVGTRPQIIKTAPLIQLALEKKLDFNIIHTGQHYDYDMTQAFFDEFKLPDPIVNLNVGSGSHVYQVATIMKRLEKQLLIDKPDILIVPGDTTSALASALTASKMNIPIAHVESGARSYDMTMPEEVNRRLIDHCSKLLFCVTKTCIMNLYREGLDGYYVEFTGDTMYDAYLKYFKGIKDSSVDFSQLRNEKYCVLTLHRPSNIDDRVRLLSIVLMIKDLTKRGYVVVFSVHPHTRKNLKRNGYLKYLNDKKIILTEPLDYVSMLKLVEYASVLLTDSGGLQKEAFWLRVPSIILRDRTEWVELVQNGSAFLVGNDAKLLQSKVLKYVEYIENDEIKVLSRSNPFGNGKASEKILKVIHEYEVRR